MRSFLLGVAIWSHLLVLLLSSMLIISSAPLIVLTLFWLLLSILFLMSVLLVRRLLLASVFYLAPLRLLVDAWRNWNEGCFWAVKLDVYDSGGHLDVTLRAVAGTLTNRVKIATTQVPAVGALLLGFQRMLGMVRSKYLPGGLHGCEGAAVSVSALAVARAVWSKKLPMTNTPALLSLLDGPWDLIRLSLSFGVAFDNFDGISLFVLMRKIAFFDC